MKRKGIIGLIGLLALSLALPVAAGAEMYGEVYMGGVAGGLNFSRHVNTSTSYNHPALIPPVGVADPFTAYSNSSHSFSGGLDPAVIGGLKIGTWFVKEGTLGHDYPNWMKYLGFFIDFSYQRLVMHGEGTTSTTESGQYGTWDPPRVVFLGMGNYSSSATGRNNFVSEGMAATLAFMFTARYGLLADSDVPFGRLQPYVAVGPGILFTSQNIKFSYTDPSGRGYSIQDSDSATNICLVADAGIRWMAFKSVSIDAFFRYRYAAPQYSYMKTLNLFSGNLGVAYHF